MDDFKENKCRMCKTMFCCKPCREKHETNKHNIFPECDICLHGKTVLRNPSPPLLMHLHESHWPLHCVFCKRVFESTEELVKYKCPIGLKVGEDGEKSPYTSFHSYNEHTYESPPLSALYHNEDQRNKNPNLFSTLATSTPMQKGENNILEKMQVITPVDYSDINKESIIKKKRLNSSRSGSPKKVTFSDTPLTESKGNQKSVLNKGEHQPEETVFSTPNVGGTFYSATEEAPQENANVAENNIHPIDQPQSSPEIIITSIDNEVDENYNQSNSQSLNSSPVVISDAEAADTKETDKPDKENTPVKQEDSAKWLSAIDLSVLDVDKKRSPPSKTNLYTPVAPMVGKFKKRQVHVVFPTPIVKREEIKITIESPLLEFLTPLPFETDMVRADNDKELSAILKPKTDIVCKQEENIPTNQSINTSCRSEENTSPTLEKKLEDCNDADQQENSITENNTNSESSADLAVNTMHGLLRSLLSKVTSAIAQGFSSVDENEMPNAQVISLKRSSTDGDSQDEPPAKKCKLTEVRCRRPIRNLPNIEITRDNTRIVYAAQCMRVFVDKATQTDE